MQWFRDAVIDEAVRGVLASASSLRPIAREAGVATAILVEGVSDQAAVETLAARRDPDLEAELIRALGADEVERAIEAEGDLRALRSLQRQPAQRGRTREQQLHRFMGSIGGRKARYASALITALGPGRIPPPLDRLMDSI